MGKCISKKKNEDSVGSQDFPLKNVKEEKLAKVVPVELSAGMSSWDRCMKHTDHNLYTPIHKFQLSHLPLPFRHNNVYDLINLTAELTVRLRMKIISQDRPDFMIFSKFRGGHVTHTGTGTVFHVENNTDDTITCPCSKCDNSVARSLVYIRTAAHVIFDDFEAKHTQADLFFDYENDEENVTTVYGVCMNLVDHEKDISEIICVTHDKDVADMLITSVEKLHKYSNHTIKSLIVADMSAFSNNQHDYSQDIILHRTESHYNYTMPSYDHISKKEEMGVLDDNNPLLTKIYDEHEYAVFGLTEIIHLKANGNKEPESEMENIEVTVEFPDGEVSMQNIWMFDYPVKETKRFLLQQGGINNISPDELIMIIESSDKTEILMNDQELMSLYIPHLTEADCLIKFVLNDSSSYATLKVEL